ncbi:MAG: tetratricopeptide repeat protein, partial [Acidobacteria bacterium]|nr:tetratricopeptide repeat protein [Acidobacteriota bacterium]
MELPAYGIQPFSRRFMIRPIAPSPHPVALVAARGSLPKALRVLAVTVAWAWTALAVALQAQQAPEGPAALAVEHERAGDFAGAEKAYRELLATSPGDPDLLRRLGVACQRQGKYEETISIFQEILKRAPMYPQVNLFLGTSYYALNRFNEAIAAFQKELAGNPSEHRARFNLALTFSATGRLFEAIQQLEALLAEDPENATYIYQLAVDYKAATRKTGQRLAQLHPHSAFTHALQAEAFADSERLDQAILEFNEVLKKNPAFPGVHLGLGEVYWRKKEYDDALKHLRLALEEDPNQPLVNY